MIEIVKRYRKAGLSVIPVTEGKVPARKWEADQKQIRSDGIDAFQDCKYIGIVAGKVSGNLECIDVDCKNDRSGLLWRQFTKKIPPDLLEKVVVQTTTNKGYHLLYRCPDTEIHGNKAIARKYEDEKTVALIETRGEGGYFVVSPSQGYKVIQGQVTDIPEITPDQRRLIMFTARSLDQVRPKTTKKDDAFEKYNKEADILELLERHNWQIVREKGDNVLLKRPGNTDSKWSASWSESMRIFYCFTSSTQFDENEGYSPVGVYTTLEHAGNYHEASKKLREQYGTDRKNGVEKNEKHTPDEIRDMLAGAKINLEEKLEKPPTIISFSQMDGANFDRTRVMTLGNFSTITGKSKSKKSYFAGMITSAALMGGEFQSKINGRLPSDKQNILYFDTEQGQYDAQKGAMRIVEMGGKKTNFDAFCLRDFSYLDRCAAIDYMMQRMKGIGLVVIDGIADLIYSINEESEATRVLELLMRWSKQANVHIINVIHQNKADNFATGHVGSTLMKKSEVVIEIEKVKNKPWASLVKCNMIRGAKEFESFAFVINSDGLPEVEENFKEYDQDKILGEKEEMPF